MKSSKASWITALVGVAVAAALPLLAHWLRRNSRGGCDLDGLPIDPTYQVEVVGHDGRRHLFCCVKCAALWIERQPDRPLAVTVTDEWTGRPVDARNAAYVRSLIATNPVTGNRIHVFADAESAKKYQSNNPGTAHLTEGERPFAQLAE